MTSMCSPTAARDAPRESGPRSWRGSEPARGPTCCAPRRLACRYWAGRVALRENRAPRQRGKGNTSQRRHGAMNPAWQGTLKHNADS
jgi:hypothetical protein